MLYTRQIIVCSQGYVVVGKGDVRVVRRRQLRHRGLLERVSGAASGEKVGLTRTHCHWETYGYI